MTLEKVCGKKTYSVISPKQIPHRAMSQDYSFDLKTFPSTRFQGSKRKLAAWIYDNIRDLDFNSALDAFGGTGTVSYLLKRMGKKVMYNDILKSNCTSASALIENNSIRLTTEEIDSLCSYRKANAKKGFVSTTFNQCYFTQAENLWLDYIINYLQMNNDGTKEYSYKQCLIHHALFQTLLCKRPFNMFHRKNLHLRTARVTRSFGNKTTWETPIRLLFRRFLEEANKCVFSGRQPCKVTNKDVFCITDSRHDLVYLDPPYLSRYGNNETADYRSIYHFLEGMAHNDKWPQMVNYSSPIRSLRNNSPNPWINKNLNQKAFDLMFDRFAKSILVISYKSNGIPSINTITRMLKRHGRTVRTVSRQHTYALMKPSSERYPNREYLIISQ
jgi:adenine-specific DNA-methyltransferase